ncbi:MAG: hypothetical protein HY862_18670 [Chloroflexi bacterium]|nr:hypothetical protein [Chloroflexota bacterium]
MTQISPSRRIFRSKTYPEDAVIRVQQVIAEFKKWGWKIESQDETKAQLSGIQLNHWFVFTYFSALGILGFPIALLIDLYLLKKLEVEVHLINDNQVRVNGSLGRYTISDNNRVPPRYVTSRKVLILGHAGMSGFVTIFLLLLLLSN